MKAPESVAERPANRLAREKSPYLLQHAHNPVDWYPWGETAFARAKKENKPIFLSIGYSTCHWCHVMERESFEDPEIARLLNESFVSIKVDREERPDVDSIYMAYVQAATGGGGWPMSVFLTPSLKPFYGGTYFPPTDREGRPGFRTLLGRIAAVWKSEPERLESAADSAVSQLQAAVGREQGGSDITARAVEAVYEAVRESYDPVHGGFGGGPKFPRPAALHFLLRRAARGDGTEARAMVAHTLRRMADGGIHDRVGGGFHRYAVDERWRLPHFEKMLYDQAQMAMAYTEAWLVTRDEEWAGVARGILDYVRRDMTGPEGQFYSAEDADSPEPGHPERLAEGAFYAWEMKEIKAVLGPDAAVAARHYGLREDGNLTGPAAGELRGKNLLIVSESLAETAKAASLEPAEVRRLLARARDRLFEARGRRPRPRLDDKALAAWNGLMISAFARAANAFGNTEYLEAAQQAMRFVHHRLVRENERLWRRFRAGETAVEGGSLDYACLVQASLDLYEATFEPRHLEWALRFQDRQVTLFWDEAGGGFFDSPDDPRLLLRIKEAYDGAEPSANSISALNLLRLEHAAPGRGYGERADALFAAFSQTLHDAPESAPQMAAALALRIRGLRQVVVAGAPGAPDTQGLLKALRQAFLPDVMVFLADGGPAQQELVKRMPFLRDIGPREGKAAAYVCRASACQPPVTDPRAMLEALAPSGESA